MAIRLKKWDLIFNFGTFSKYDHISLESKLLTLFGLKSIFRLLYRRVSSVVVVSRIYITVLFNRAVFSLAWKGTFESKKIPGLWFASIIVYK